MQESLASFNLFDPTLVRNPFPAYAALRESAPIHEGAQGLVYVSSYEYVIQVLRGKQHFGKRGFAAWWRELLGPGSLSETTTNWLFFLDPPLHTRVRNLAGQSFTYSRIATLRSLIQSVTDDLLADVESHDTRDLDIIAELAFPLPIIVIGKILGVPTEDRLQLLAWTNDYVPAMSLDATPDIVTKANQAMEAYREYFTWLIAQRSAVPEAALIESAVEECLRFWTPTQYEFYSALETVELGGKTIPAGQLLVTLLGAANRDEAHFLQADRFDIERTNSGEHVALGYGSHYCLGAPLARFEAQIALLTLFQRIPRLQLATDPGVLEWKSGLLLRGLKSLPVTF